MRRMFGIGISCLLLATFLILPACGQTISTNSTAAEDTELTTSPVTSSIIPSETVATTTNNSALVITTTSALTTNNPTTVTTSLSSPSETQTPLGYTTYGTANNDAGPAMPQIMTLTSRDDNKEALASWVLAETQNELNAINYDANIIIMVFSGSGHANHGIHISEIWQLGVTIGVRVEFLPLKPASNFATPLYSYSYAQVSRSTLKQTGNITFKLFDLVSGAELASTNSNIQSYT